WVKLLTIPYRLIFPTVIFLIAIGVYSTNNDLFDVAEVLVIGIFGYILVCLDFQPAPLLLGFVLGPMVEENFRRALLLSHGDLSVFISEPVSGTCMALIVLFAIYLFYKCLQGKGLLASSA